MSNALALLQAAGLDVGDVDLVGDDDGASDEEIQALLASGGGDPYSLLAAGDVDIVGALPQLRRVGSAGLTMSAATKLLKATRVKATQDAVAKLQAKGALGVVERPFLQAKRIPAAFSKLIPANTTETVVIKASVPFRPRRFVIPPSLAEQFVIESMQIGMGMQILGNEPVPCEAILPDAVGGDWHLPTVQTSQEIVMRVSNITAAEARFRGVCWGEAAVPAGG